jgi:nucleoside-diphosphate-sugar epimerase
MKVLVLGATGYLGSRLFAALAREGWEAHGLTHQAQKPLPPQGQFGSKPQFATLGGSYLHSSELGAQLVRDERFDLIVNAATKYERGASALPAVIEANLYFPLGILLAAAEAPAAAFLNCGTSLPATLNSYSRAKSDFVEWGRRLAEAGGPRFVELKLETIFGPGDAEDKFPTFVIRNCLRNAPEIPLSPGTQLRDFIYVDEAVAAILATIKNGLALEARASGAPAASGARLETGASPITGSRFTVVPIGTGEGTSLIEFCRATQTLTGAQTAFRFGQLPFRENEVMRSVADLTSIRAFGWKPRLSLAQALQKTIDGERAIDKENKCAF